MILRTSVEVPVASSGFNSPNSSSGRLADVQYLPLRWFDAFHHPPLPLLPLLVMRMDKSKRVMRKDA